MQTSVSWACETISQVLDKNVWPIHGGVTYYKPKIFVWEVQSDKVFFYRPYKTHCSILNNYKTAKCAITTKCFILGSYRTLPALSSVPGRLTVC